ncbi:MAG: Epimerase family protein [bacterium ADurb.Bin243]|nr:MAG: Epimerase family protein [bacterium ADurb.Bin243]
MNILISGASGFIGSHLAARLSSKGHSVKALRRQDYALPAESFASRFEGVDAVVNLSGADIAARWSEEYKKEIYESRVGCTRKIVEAIKSLPNRPRLLINASASGIYESGLSHDEYKFRYGGDFLAKLCGDWEAAALEARESGVRTVIFRFSVVLDKSGGALKKMLLPFSLGLGATIGGGGQYMSWVALTDLLAAFEFLIAGENLDGVFNICSPRPVTNREFTAALAAALKRPAFFRVPEFALRLAFSGAEKIICEGAAVYPKRLIESGFRFEFEDIKSALDNIINRVP